MTPHPNRKALRRFFLNISVQPDGCWRWDGTCSNSGYGSLTWNYIKGGAHRIAYLWFVREIESGEVIDHLCRHKRCVNPAHLEAVTASENMRRSISAVSGERREQWRREQYQQALAKLAQGVEVDTVIHVRRSA